jgi:hypothetical protein
VLIFRGRTDPHHEKILKLRAIAYGQAARETCDAHGATEKHQTILKVARKLLGACA